MSDIDLELEYSQQRWLYPAGGEPVIVPFEIACKHFGYEVNGHGKIFRNTAEKQADGDETQYYQTRACILPWGWANDDKPVSRKDQVSRSDRFDQIKDAWENKIQAKLVNIPRKISVAQFDALPA